MKIIKALLVGVIGYLALFGLILPKLFSTNNNLAVVVGVAILLVTTYYVVYYCYEQFKGEDNQ